MNARVAMAELDLTRAQECIAKGLSAMEGFEVPLASWRVHATAFELYQNSGNRDLAERHLALSRETVMKLAKFRANGRATSTDISVSVRNSQNPRQRC